MSEDIRADDVVVCINDSVNEQRTVDVPFPNFLKLGRVYRVARSGVFRGVRAIQLAGDPNMTRYPRGAWAASRFRKLPPASQEFTEQMRACRPAKQGEPA